MESRLGIPSEFLQVSSLPGVILTELDLLKMKE